VIEQSEHDARRTGLYPSTAPPNDPRKGCLAPRTDIPPGILFLIALEFVFALLLILYYCIDVLKTRSLSGSRKEVAERLPYGQTSWIVHAIRERHQGRNSIGSPGSIKKNMLKDWDLVVEEGYDFPRLKYRDKLQGTAVAEVR
jgi:hypothetical protein